MAFADALRDTLLKTFTRGHRLVADLSGGRLGKTTADLPIVKLTTTGRRSGKPRIVMLAAPILEGDRVVVVASKGGADHHPDWYHNLVANPEVIIELVGGDGPRPMLARTATPEARAELWPRIATGEDGYAAYQRKTEREIPLVICEPAD